ncbi:MAG TPA: leucine--tRNA ligase, partial [Verrucomicrobiales bacterium]|nr:leucine--tRNA ligase [Verrucomicrobiales bacterium]
EVNTTDPGYVRWTQWIFLQIYNSYFDVSSQRARPVAELEEQGWTKEQIDNVRLAYVAEAPVNWCASLGTVLANEEVSEWEEKGHEVERRPLQQWMLRITSYAQRLIDELEDLDWPEGIKMLQRNWIGRSEGARVVFALAPTHNEEIEVFTTRPDTLFGATYMVLAPEHPLVDQITTEPQREAVTSYRKLCATKSEMERGELNKEKTGVATGAFAVNPVNNERIPVWIADYVMMGYGTGAIMAVPGHDSRDLEFATKFDLPVVQVVEPLDNTAWQGFTGEGSAVNSGFLDGMATPEAKRIIKEWLEENNRGEGQINYKLRDWLFSRQRYWGEPFPILWKDGRHEALEESALPLLAPELEDYNPSGEPEPLLSKATKWVQAPNGKRRETNTMPQWAGSCWYYLRYCDPTNSEQFLSPEARDYWLGGPGNTGGVDLYIGGTEHAVLHLLYARFWHKILNDLGHLNTPEPFQRLVNQGLIMGEDGRKMSKSLGNVINPDDVVAEYGADAFRLYEMFMGPLEQVKPWNTQGVEGVSRFLAKVWRVAMVMNQEGEWAPGDKLGDNSGDPALLKIMHATIKKVGEDIEKLRFNTAISQMMECINAFKSGNQVPHDLFRSFLILLNPFAPHLTEELWEQLKYEGSCLEAEWPAYDKSLLVEEEIEMVVQVNGKVRSRIQVAAAATKEELESSALTDSKIADLIEALTVRKVIVVPGRLVNIVAN